MILNYKNKWSLIFDILFRSKKIKKIVSDIDYKIIDKLNFISDSYQNKNNKYITTSNLSKVVTLMEMPIMNPRNSSDISIKITNANVETIQTTYTFNDVDLEIVKKHLSEIISKKIVEEKLVTCDIQGNKITFKINIIK